MTEAYVKDGTIEGEYTDGMILILKSLETGSWYETKDGLSSVIIEAVCCSSRRSVREGTKKVMNPCRFKISDRDKLGCSWWN